MDLADPIPTVSSTGNGPNNSGTTTTTAPNVSDIEDPGTNETPCQKLHKLLIQNSIAREGLHALENRLLTQRVESGFVFNNDASGFHLSPSFNNGPHSANYKLTPTTEGSAHNHPPLVGDDEPNYPMFSPADLQPLVKINNLHPTTPGNPIPFNYSLMVVEGYTYAIVPNNPSTLTAIESKFLNLETLEKFNKELYNKYVAIGNPWDCGQLPLAKLFLEFVNIKYNLNISIYQIPNADFDNPNNTWKKVILNPNATGGVETLNCN